MAKVVPPEAVIEALGGVKYPGFPTDILSLGIVEDVTPKPGGQGFAIYAGLAMAGIALFISVALVLLLPRRARAPAKN